jgi:hypothetical protein
MTHVRRYPLARALRRTAALAAVARVALVLLLVALAAVLWLLFASLWAAAAGRAIPPVA